MKRWSASVLVCTVVMLVCAPCYAGEYTDQMNEKFKRGVTNVVSSVAEIGKTMSDEVQDVKFLPFDLISGLIDGTIKMMNRLLRGVYDIVVAPIPDVKTFPPDPEYLFKTDEQ